MVKKKNNQKDDPRQERMPFPEHIKKKAERKLKAQSHSREQIWYGLGMSGVVGLLVMIPTLLFLYLGIWLDQKFSSSYSWTLMGLLFGIFLGCLNAWYWLEKQRAK